MRDPNYIKYYELKDKCRKELIPYLHKALSLIPQTKNPHMLDVGCGTGVPTLALIKYFGGFIKAIDLDTNAVSCLKEKIQVQNLLHAVDASNNSVFDLADKNETYDIILAEGLLNVVGFKKGLSALVKLAKKDAFLVIHDDKKNIAEKSGLFEQYNCRLIESFILTEKIWWNNYYKHLENQINQIKDGDLLKLFNSDINELHTFEKHPSLFQSVYYVLKKTN